MQIFQVHNKKGCGIIKALIYETINNTGLLIAIKHSTWSLILNVRCELIVNKSSQQSKKKA